MIGKLLDLYRNDPDAGIHGAAAWTVRQWKQDAKLRNVDAELIKLKDRGDRRWFVNSQGQTFAVIEGPVEFRMGSPPTEPIGIQLPRSPDRRIIPHRFAIAAQEVTIEQSAAFVKENPLVDRAANEMYSSGPNCPINGVNWYEAAAYCNWLEPEGEPAGMLPPNEVGQYRAGMQSPVPMP